ncbi:MAG: phytanoyl-CoA dioxygenase [bacterium]|nr:phytanoyl-CoA dioxygenase [bacterium]
MKLTNQQLEQYREEGLLFIPSCFSRQEVGMMQEELDLLVGQHNPGEVFESDKKTVRGLHGCHMRSDLFGRLTRIPRVLEPSRQILNDEVYVHQFKINFKRAFGGDTWPWHQDYVFWNKEDGMPKVEVVNIAICLNEVNEFNGPMYFVPGSHKKGLLDVESRVKPGKDNWKDSVSAYLKYSLDNETVRGLVKERGMTAPKGPAGSLLIFHPNLAHSSAPNISPYDRILVILTYNSVHNIPHPPGKPRPEFLVGRDYTPLQALPGDTLT